MHKFTSLFLGVGCAFISTQALAQTSTDNKCTYHNVSYSDGAMICVGTNYGQTCSKGSWSTFGPASNDPSFAQACKSATSVAPTDK
jgi:hypothetical protein